MTGIPYQTEMVLSLTAWRQVRTFEDKKRFPFIFFELRYWIDVHQHNAAQIASDLRYMIAGSLAVNGIGIAFPQRDVHVDAASPLRIQLLPLSAKERA